MVQAPAGVRLAPSQRLCPLPITGVTSSLSSSRPSWLPFSLPSLRVLFSPLSSQPFSPPSLQAPSSLLSLRPFSPELSSLPSSPLFSQAPSSPLSSPVWQPSLPVPGLPSLPLPEPPFLPVPELPSLRQLSLPELLVLPEPAALRKPASISPSRFLPRRLFRRRPRTPQSKLPLLPRLRRIRLPALPSHLRLPARTRHPRLHKVCNRPASDMPSGLRVSFEPLYEYARIPAKLRRADYSNSAPAVTRIPRLRFVQRSLPCQNKMQRARCGNFRSPFHRTLQPCAST